VLNRYDARRSRESYRQQQQQDGDGPYSAAWPLPASNDPSNAHSDSTITSTWPRMHFQFDSHPAVLQLQGVSEQDEGFYRCRVDFGRSPTRHRLVQLSIVGKAGRQAGSVYSGVLIHF